MRLFAVLVSACVFLGFVLCPPITAYEEVEAGQIVASPEDYVGRYVTMKVKFRKIDNVYHGWEHQANLKQDRTIKFFVSPLSEIACYADKVPDNEKTLGSLRAGQELVISGHVKKCKKEAKVKGERGSAKRSVKGVYHYVFIVKKVESVGEAAAPARIPGMRRRRRGL